MSLALALNSIYHQYYQLFDFIVYMIVFSSIFKIALSDFFKKDPPTLVLVSTILGAYLALYLEVQMGFRLLDLRAWLFLFFLFIIIAGIAKKFIKFSEKKL